MFINNDMENGSTTDNLEFGDLSTRTMQKIVRRAKLACAVCGWDEDSCDIHHIIGRAVGGTNNVSNLACICPNCHRKAHSRKISVEYLLSVSMKDFDWKKFYRQSRVRKVNDDQIIEWAGKLTTVELSRKFGISIKTVYSILNSARIKPKARKLKFEISKEELQKLASDVPMTVIGEMFGVSDNAVKKRCIKLGIELKPMRGHWSKNSSLGR